MGVLLDTFGAQFLRRQNLTWPWSIWPVVRVEEDTNPRQALVVSRMRGQSNSLQAPRRTEI